MFAIIMATSDSGQSLVSIIGVRIEDDYLVLPNGTLRKLSGQIPSAPDEVERIMSSRR